MNKKIFSILLASMLVFLTKSNTPVLLLTKISKITPIVEDINMKDLLIKLRFKGQARALKIQDILDKKHKAIAFKTDSFDAVKRNYLTVELHNKTNYDGKKPIASESIIVNEKKQVRHKLNLGPLKVSVRTQVKYNSELIKAVEDDNLKKVNELLKNAKEGSDKINALLLSIKLDHTNIAKAIIQSGITTEEKEKALLEAISLSRTSIAKAIIESGITANQKEKAFFKAAKSNNNKDFIKLLLEAGITNDVLSTALNNDRANIYKDEIIDLIKLEQSIIEKEKPKIKINLGKLNKEDRNWIINRALKNNSLKKLLPKDYQNLIKIYDRLIAGNITDEEVVDMLTGKNITINQGLINSNELYYPLLDDLFKILYLHKVGILKDQDSSIVVYDFESNQNSNYRQALKELLSKSQAMPVSIAAKIVLEY